MRQAWIASHAVCARSHSPAPKPLADVPAALAAAGSNAKQYWANESPMGERCRLLASNPDPLCAGLALNGARRRSDCDAKLLEQAARNKAQVPTAKVFIYRNLVLAMCAAALQSRRPHMETILRAGGGSGGGGSCGSQGVALVSLGAESG